MIQNSYRTNAKLFMTEEELGMSGFHAACDASIRRKRQLTRADTAARGLNYGHLEDENSPYDL